MPTRRSPRRDELPVDHYDQLPMHALLHRIRALDADELRLLLAYEHEHADRLHVTRILDARLGQLASGPGPKPS